MNEENETFFSQTANSDIEDNTRPPEGEEVIKDRTEESENVTSNKKNNRRFPIWVIVFFLFVLALDIISMIQFPKVFHEYKLYKKAESRIAEGDTYQALYDLSEVAKNHPKATPVIMKSIDLSIEQGYYDLAADVYDNCLMGSSLSDTEYARAENFRVELNKFFNTYEEVDRLFSAYSEVQDSKEIDFEQLTADLTGYLSRSELDQAYIYYSLGLITEDGSESQNYFQDCYNLNPEMFDVRVQIAIRYRRQGELKKARQFCEEALAKEKQDSGALRVLATIQILEGDLENSLISAEAAYKSYPDGYYVRDTYLIALHFNEKKEEADKIQKEIESTSGTLDEDTIQLLNGEITLEDYYVGD